MHRDVCTTEGGNRYQTENGQHVNLLHITVFRADLARWSKLGFRALILFYYSFEKRHVGGKGRVGKKEVLAIILKKSDLLTLSLSSGV